MPHPIKNKKSIYLSLYCMIPLAPPFSYQSVASQSHFTQDNDFIYIENMMGLPTGLGPNNDDTDGNALDWDMLWSRLMEPFSDLSSLAEPVPSDNVVLVDSPGGAIAISIDGDLDVNARPMVYILSAVMLGVLGYGQPSLALKNASSSIYFNQRDDFNNGDRTCAITSTAIVVGSLMSPQVRPPTPAELDAKYGFRTAQDVSGREMIMREVLQAARSKVSVTSGVYSWEEFLKRLENSVAVAGGYTTSSGHVIAVMGKYRLTTTQINMLKDGKSLQDILVLGPKLSKPGEKTQSFLLAQDPWGKWVGGGGLLVGEKAPRNYTIPNKITIEYQKNKDPNRQQVNSKAEVTRGHSVFIPEQTFKQAFLVSENGEPANVAAAFATPHDPHSTRIFELVKGQTSSPAPQHKQPLPQKQTQGQESKNAPTPALRPKNYNPGKTEGLAYITQTTPLYMPNQDPNQPMILKPGSLVVFRGASDASWLPVYGVVAPVEDGGWDQVGQSEGALWMPDPSVGENFTQCFDWKVCITVKETPIFGHGGREVVKVLQPGTVVQVSERSEKNGGWLKVKAIAQKFQEGTNSTAPGALARKDTSLNMVQTGMAPVYTLPSWLALGATGGGVEVASAPQAAYQGAVPSTVPQAYGVPPPQREQNSSILSKLSSFLSNAFASSGVVTHPTVEPTYPSSQASPWTAEPPGQMPLPPTAQGNGFPTSDQANSMAPQGPWDTTQGANGAQPLPSADQNQEVPSQLNLQRQSRGG